MGAATRGELRGFGLGVGGILTGIGLLALLAIWPFGDPHPRLGGALTGLGSGLVLLGAVAPRVLAPARATWLRLVAPVAWLNTRLLLGLVYYGVLLPTGLLRRWRRDPLGLRSTGQTSYWVSRDGRPGPESYRRQI